MNYVVFIVRIVHVWVEKQTAVKPRDTISEKQEEFALIVVSWRDTQRSLPLSPKISFHILGWYLKSIFVYLTYFSHNYDIYSMFRNVPGCSHVPGLVDGLLRNICARGRPFSSWGGGGGVADFEKKILQALVGRKNCMQHKWNRKKFLHCYKQEKKICKAISSFLGGLTKSQQNCNHFR